MKKKNTTWAVLGKEWVPKIELSGRIIFIAGILLSFLMAFLFNIELGKLVLITIVVSFSIEAIGIFLLYHNIKEPLIN
jgi:hypothetical protein